MTTPTSTPATINPKPLQVFTAVLALIFTFVLVRILLRDDPSGAAIVALVALIALSVLLSVLAHV